MLTTQRPPLTGLTPARLASLIALVEEQADRETEAMDRLESEAWAAESRASLHPMPGAALARQAAAKRALVQDWETIAEVLRARHGEG